MIITKAKITLAAATTKGERPVLEHVHYNPENGRLEASDGFVLASVPVKLEEGETVGDCLIPLATIREAQKLATAKGKSPELSFDESLVTAASVPASEKSGERVQGETRQLYTDYSVYPDVQQIRPHSESLRHLVTLDVKKLYDLARAICEDSGNRAKANLYVNVYQGQRKSSPLVVEPLGDSRYGPWHNPRIAKEHKPNYNDGPWGLLMPMHHEED